MVLMGLPIEAFGGLEAASFENSLLIHILLEKYNSTCILPQPLLSISEKNIFTHIFSQNSHIPYFDAH